jgi:hypothetical protein
MSSEMCEQRDVFPTSNNSFSSVSNLQPQKLPYCQRHTGLYVSPSRISDMCDTVTGMAMPNRKMSTEGEVLKVPVPPYRCSICPPCYVCLGCCATKFGSSGGAYKLPCTILLQYIPQICMHPILQKCSKMHELPKISPPTSLCMTV